MASGNVRWPRLFGQPPTKALWRRSAPDAGPGPWQPHPEALWGHRRPRSGRRRVAQHLLHRPPVDAEPPHRAPRRTSPAPRHNRQGTMSGASLRRRDRTARPPRVVHYSSALDICLLTDENSRRAYLVIFQVESGTDAGRVRWQVLSGALHQIQESVFQNPEERGDSSCGIPPRLLRPRPASQHLVAPGGDLRPLILKACSR